jgi:hypothetical protein
MLPQSCDYFYLQKIVGLSMTSPDLETLMDGYVTYNLYLGKNFSSQKKTIV